MPRCAGHVAVFIVGLARLHAGAWSGRGVSWAVSCAHLVFGFAGLGRWFDGREYVQVVPSMFPADVQVRGYEMRWGI